MNRRTSIYTIRLTGHTATAATVDTLADRLPNVADRGEASVSFRTTDDHAALTAARAAAVADTGWTLTTGLGVHRRTVTR